MLPLWLFLTMLFLAGADRFEKKAVKLKKQMWWQNKKMCLILTAVVALVVIILTVAIYHVNFLIFYLSLSLKRNFYVLAVINFSFAFYIM